MFTGCSKATLESNISTTAQKAGSTANSMWRSAGRLWPSGLWPAGVWVADYEEADRLAAESGNGTLFLFTQKDLTREDELRTFLEDPANRGAVVDYTPALLFQKNERDRRYAAQFSVTRAPAVIVRHPDGTYHAMQGSLTPEKLADFLVRAQPPGEVPVLNPFVSRQVGFAWIRDWDAAREASKVSGKPVFVVLERWMSRDWDMLAPMIERREVYSRTSGMIHCRPATAWNSATEAASQLGIENLPAVAILPPDGEPAVLELPASYEAIVHFTDRATGRANTNE